MVRPGWHGSAEAHTSPPVSGSGRNSFWKQARPCEVEEPGVLHSTLGHHWAGLAPATPRWSNGPDGKGARAHVISQHHGNTISILCLKVKIFPGPLCI